MVLTGGKSAEPASMDVHTQFDEGNEEYRKTFGEKGKLAIPPARKLIILTCMDSRINPPAQLGLKEGDAHIIRNAGGVAKDALRSIIISQRMLGTREIAVFHHSDCGMVKFTSPQLRSILKDSADPAEKDEVEKAASKVEFLEFRDERESVIEDVKFLEENPLVMKGTKVTGWLYHPHSGKIDRVV